MKKQTDNKQLKPYIFENHNITSSNNTLLYLRGKHLYFRRTQSSIFEAQYLISNKRNLIFSKTRSLVGQFFVTPGSLFHRFWDMLGHVWEYRGDVFGQVWEGFEKKLRRGRKKTQIPKMSGIIFPALGRSQQLFLAWSRAKHFYLFLIIWGVGGMGGALSMKHLKIHGHRGAQGPQERPRAGPLGPYRV